MLNVDRDPLPVYEMTEVKYSPDKKGNSKKEISNDL
jgi:hypothetical protein